MTTARQRIADAVTTTTVIEGTTVQIKGYPSRPVTPATWDAWPWLASADPINPYALATTWSVYVVLPAGDPGAIADAVDALLVTLAGALWAANLPMTRAVTGSLQLDVNSPSVPCLMLTVTV
jgi:hypothetical protein